MSMIQVGNNEPEKEKFKVTIELQQERYFSGQRVSQVVNSNVNQLLVALWEEKGFYKIDRRTSEKKVTLIEDETEIERNYHCTDLVGIRSENENHPSYIQYYIARTEAAINIVDTVKEKIYCLHREQN